MTRFHLAQVNIGRFRAPLDDPIMQGFRTALDPINALADQSPGFVWRLQTEDGDATAIRPYANDDLMAINMSVWESLESLQQFVYKSHHVESLRARGQWFERIEGPILALWWIPAGQLPTVPEALDRLRHLKERGPTPNAFTFRTPFPPPDGQPGGMVGPDAVFCDWASQTTSRSRSLPVRIPLIVFMLASAAATAAAQRLQPAIPTFNPTLAGPQSPALRAHLSTDHTPSHVWEGAIVGGVLTGGFTALLVHGLCEDSDSNTSGGGCTLPALEGFVFGAVPGVVVGGIIGSLFPKTPKAAP